MRREPPVKGPGLLFRYRRHDVERGLLLVAHQTSASQLRAVSHAVREASRAHQGWTVDPETIQDCATASTKATRTTFTFALDHFCSNQVHMGLIDRVLRRLLGGCPGTDFLQHSGVARGERYFDRPTARNEVLQAVAAGRWVLVEAVRRFGKTSFLVNLEATPKPPWIPVYVSLESGTSPSYLARALVAHAVCNRPLRHALPKTLLEGIDEKAAPYEAMDRLIAAGRSPEDDLRLLWEATATAGLKTVFLVDELALYLLNVRLQLEQSASDDGAWRRWVIETLDLLQQGVDDLRYVFAGSLHLPSLLSGHLVEHPLLDQMRPVAIAPLPVDDAETMMRLALLQERLLANEDELAWLVDRFGGWLPSFALRFIQLLGQACRDQGHLSRDEQQDLYRSLFASRNSDLFADLDVQHVRHAEYVDEPAFRQRLCRVLVVAAEHQTEGIAADELARVFHQTPEYGPSVTAGERDQLWGLALTVARQDYSLVEREGQVGFACNMIADWAISRRHLWGVD